MAISAEESPAPVSIPETTPQDRVLSGIAESLPKFFRFRDQDFYDEKTLNCYVSRGIGPEVVEIRGIRFLERESFVRWLSEKGALKRRGRKRISDQNPN